SESTGSSGLYQLRFYRSGKTCTPSCRRARGQTSSLAVSEEELRQLSGRALSRWRSRISPTTASPAGSSQRSENYVSCQLEPLRCNDARISPTTASPEARGKLGAHSYERTTSALSGRFEARDKRRSGERGSVIHRRESR